MRILYGKDYYDNALAYGRDESIVLIRDKKNLMTDEEIVVGPWNHQQVKYVGKNKFIFDPVKVLFCGKVYHGYRSTAEFDYQDYTRSQKHVMFHWNNAEFIVWLKSVGIEKFSLSQMSEPYKHAGVFENPRIRDWMIENKVFSAIRFPESLDRKLVKRGIYDDWVAMHWMVNSDQLKAVQFYKVMDHYAAFQEISMWVGGVLPKPGNPMVEISDIVRIEKHGFDKKSSFRKEKQ